MNLLPDAVEMVSICDYTESRRCEVRERQQDVNCSMSGVHRRHHPQMLLSNIAHVLLGLYASERYRLPLITYLRSGRKNLGLLYRICPFVYLHIFAFSHRKSFSAISSHFSVTLPNFLLPSGFISKGAGIAQSV
jgi:hypothetical protein